MRDQAHRMHRTKVLHQWVTTLAFFPESWSHFLRSCHQFPLGMLIFLSIHPPPIYPLIYLSVHHLSTHPFIHLPACLPFYLLNLLVFVHLSICIFTCPFIPLSIYPSPHPPIHQFFSPHTHPWTKLPCFISSIYTSSIQPLPTSLPICPSKYPSIHQSIFHPSTHPPIHTYIHTFIHHSFVHPSIYHSTYLLFHSTIWTGYRGHRRYFPTETHWLPPKKHRNSSLNELSLCGWRWGIKLGEAVKLKAERVSFRGQSLRSALKHRKHYHQQLQCLSCMQPTWISSLASDRVSKAPPGDPWAQSWEPAQDGLTS